MTELELRPAAAPAPFVPAQILGQGRFFWFGGCVITRGTFDCPLSYVPDVGNRYAANRLNDG